MRLILFKIFAFLFSNLAAKARRNTLNSKFKNHWSSYSQNPDSEDVVCRREALVRDKFSSSIPTYELVIKKFLSGKTVLDFGAANHGEGTQNIASHSTHDLVVRSAKRVYAFDIERIPNHSLNKSTCTHFKFDLINSKVVSKLLYGKFQVFFAGHTLEHLSAPGALFSLAFKILRKGDRLIVVTPNPLWINGLVSRNLGGNDSVNADHTSLFGASELIELGERNNFRIIQWMYAGIDDMSPSIDGQMLAKLGYSLNSQKEIHKFYTLARRNNFALAHNSIVAVFSKL